MWALLWFLHGLAIRLWAWLRRWGHMRVEWWVTNPDGTVAARGPRRWNLVPDAARRQMHEQLYGTPGAAWNFCALSIDAVTEGASSTALSTEIATNGLSRVGTSNARPVGSGNQTIITAAWTASGVSIPAPQKGAMFNASSSGVMHHVFAFSQGAVTLAAGQTLNIRGVVTLG